MSEFVFKLPDLGEGTVEAEIVEWHVQPGDRVSEGDIIADVMTDKANVEVPAPVTGTVLRTSGEPGDLVAVGAELAAFTTADQSAAAAQPAPAPAADTAQEPAPARKAPAGKAAAETAPTEKVPAETTTAEKAPAKRRRKAETEASIESPGAAESAQAVAAAGSAAAEPAQAAAHGERIVTSPAVRRRAKEAGVDLRTVSGSGPRGRILRSDLDAVIAGQPSEPVLTGVGGVEEIKVIGVRRVIARKMQASKREIPHFAYVDEVDITPLDSLRQRLNADRAPERPSLTYLPFIALALMRALRQFPQCNATFDAENGVIRRYERTHLGIATQTPDGLKVPVVHNASGRGLWDLASEISRVAEAARGNTATRQELSGSTITITSLGRLGGIVTTPVINAPEVGIIGVNKAVKRPMVMDNDQVEVRLMMNLSASFDHRFVDGFDAASMIAVMKDLLEEPALLFIH